MDQDRILLYELEPFVEELRKMKPHERVEYFRNPDGFTFFVWWFFYFPESFQYELAPFHFDALHYYMDTEKNILWEGFRSCLKTEITKLYIVNSICYKRWNYIVVQSYDSDSSDDMVTNVSRMLNKQMLVHDYGELYPFSSKKEDFAKKSVAHFDTTNGVKVKARALLEKIRGAATYDEDEGTSRPDLLVLDDIDTTDSVRNVQIIDKNDTKLRQETIGAMNKDRQRIIFLGNTIGHDGIVRRFAEMAKKATNTWEYIRTDLFDEKGICRWPDFFTPEVIQKLKETELDAFDQNYLLIPKLTIGKTVFDTTQPIKIAEVYKQIEGFLLFQPPQDQIVIGVDVAEGGTLGDFSTLKARNRKGQTVFEYKGQVDEVLLAQKLNWILEEYYEGEGHKKKKYLGTILIENNVGRAFINECKKQKDDGSLVYSWFKYVLKSRNLDGTIDEDDLQKKYGFRTTETSKKLLISQYRNALNRGEIDVSQGVLTEMYTFCYDDSNKPNAQSPYHDDLIMGDMIAFHGILNEPYIVKYDAVPVDLDEMTPVQRHLYRLRKLAHMNQDEDDF